MDGRKVGIEGRGDILDEKKNTDTGKGGEGYEKKIPWSKSASELYRPSDSRLSPKLLSTFADRG
jgi:hypothetical protein